MSVSLLMFRLLSNKKYRVNFGFIEIQFFACLAESSKRQYALNLLASQSAMNFWRVEKETGTQGSGPMKGESDAILASSSAFSLP